MSRSIKLQELEHPIQISKKIKLYIYIYIYMCVCVCVCVCVCICAHACVRERVRERKLLFQLDNLTRNFKKYFYLYTMLILYR